MDSQIGNKKNGKLLIVSIFCLIMFVVSTVYGISVLFPNRQNAGDAENLIEEEENPEQASDSIIVTEEDPVSDENRTEESAPSGSEAQNERKFDLSVRNTVVFAAAVMCLILFVVFFIIYLKSSKKNGDSTETAPNMIASDKIGSSNGANDPAVGETAILSSDTTVLSNELLEKALNIDKKKTKIIQDIVYIHTDEIIP